MSENKSSINENKINKKLLSKQLIKLEKLFNSGKDILDNVMFECDCDNGEKRIIDLLIRLKNNLQEILTLIRVVDKEFIHKGKK